MSRALAMTAEALLVVPLAAGCVYVFRDLAGWPVWVWLPLVAVVYVPIFFRLWWRAWASAFQEASDA